MTTKLTALSALLAVSVSAAAGATTASGIELTASLGVRAGGAAFLTEGRPLDIVIDCFTTPCVLTDADVPSHETLMLVLDVPIAPDWAVEALAVRENGRLSLRADRGVVARRLEPESWEATTFQLGVLRRWRREQWEPFVAGALGTTRFESSAGAYPAVIRAGVATRPVDVDVLSASLAAGVRLPLGERTALRIESRLWGLDMPAHLGGGSVEPEASLGLGYRW